MRKYARFLYATLGLVLVPATFGVIVSACSDEPVGIDACRLIETARCEATTACDVSEAESAYCVSFYRDQCLHGMENKSADLSSESTNACIGAIRAVAECARTKATTMAQCPTIALVTGKDPATTKPCDIVKSTPEVLNACAFIAPADSSSSSTSSSSSSSGAVSDAGDDATDGS